jgi:hypothetical protein
MSTNQPGRDDEIRSLNADELNVQELDDQLLDQVAGGLEEVARAACSGHSCGNHWC